MKTRIGRLMMLLLVLLIAYGMGALTCYMIYPKVEVRPWIALPETDVPPVKDVF